MKKNDDSGKTQSGGQPARDPSAHSDGSQHHRHGHFDEPRSSNGHFDELAEIERFRISQQVAVRQQYDADRATNHPASQPYLRRASHRR